MTINLLDDPFLKQRPRLREACDKLHAMALEAGPEAKMPTIAELHERLGLSVQTIHRAVRELEQRNILRSVHGVGIYVASSQRLSSTGSLGVLSTYHIGTEQHTFYWNRLLSGMRSVAAQRQRQLLLVDNAHEYRGWDKIDGAVLNDSHSVFEPTPGLPLPPKNFPCVALMNRVPQAVSVMADDYDGVYTIVQYLIGLGHRRIAFLATLDSGVESLERRRDAYIAALSEAGISPAAEWMHSLRTSGAYRDTSDFYFEEGKYAVQSWLAGGWYSTGCTAVVAQNDHVAYGAMMAFREAGISVPQQVSVVGFDGSGLEYRVLPVVTSIKVPLFEIGQTAIRLLSDWLDEPGRKPDDAMLPVQLVEGESSAPPP